MSILGFQVFVTSKTFLHLEKILFSFPFICFSFSEWIIEQNNIKWTENLWNKPVHLKTWCSLNVWDLFWVFFSLGELNIIPNLHLSDIQHHNLVYTLALPLWYDSSWQRCQTSEDHDDVARIAACHFLLRFSRVGRQVAVQYSADDSWYLVY